MSPSSTASKGSPHPLLSGHDPRTCHDCRSVVPCAALEEAKRRTRHVCTLLGIQPHVALACLVGNHRPELLGDPVNAEGFRRATGLDVTDGDPITLEHVRDAARVFGVTLCDVCHLEIEGP